ncbi:hypothetical protein [Deinococcus psychrotolerans]|uniref:hypothetical protein n=1 Tax=Deinococcus psychrotolerans TaxID=2489213 RepID=UPI0013DDF6C4|nr:hypothetical protein [Deinococcus psychrotolerans]
MSGTQVAPPLSVTLPVVSHRLGLDDHAKSMETLRRMAKVLEMDVEMRLMPKSFS